MATEEPVLIEEIEVPTGDAIKVKLEDSDTPYGRKREVVAFETGGKTEIADEGIYNPGSSRVILQMMFDREKPLTLKGAFRDGLWKGGGAIGHAQFMHDLLEEVRHRKNLVKVSWSGIEWVTVLWETSFGHEDQNNITYDLTFFVAVAPGGQTNAAPTANLQESSTAEIAANMAARARAHATAQLALALGVVAAGALTLLWGSLSASLDSATLTCQLLERAATSQVLQYLTLLKKADASMSAAQAQATMLQAKIQSLKTSDAMAVVTGSSNVSWWASQQDTSTDLDWMVAQLRSARAVVQQQLRSVTRLYQVQAGDTAESIARQQLGDVSQAQVITLALSGKDLLQLAGQFIRIPRAQ